MKEHGEAPDLLDRIATDPSFHISAAELHELTHPDRFVGRAPQQVDHFLASWVEPVLARWQKDAGEGLGAPEVRV